MKCSARAATTRTWNALVKSRGPQPRPVGDQHHHADGVEDPAHVRHTAAGAAFCTSGHMMSSDQPSVVINAMPKVLFRSREERLLRLL